MAGDLVGGLDKPWIVVTEIIDEILFAGVTVFVCVHTVS